MTGEPPLDGSKGKQLVVLGGGVAGVCCAQELCRICPDAHVTLISADAVIKGVGDVRRLTKNLEEVSLRLQCLDTMQRSNMRAIHGKAASIDTAMQRVSLADGQQIPYSQLCICTGAAPKKIIQHDHVIALRDQDSIQDMHKRLQAARRVMVVGNGGIALELVHALRTVKLVWAMRNSHIGDAFFDLDAAAFLFSEIESNASAASHPSHGSLELQNGHDEEGKRHGGNALPRMRRLQRSGSISFTQRQGWPGEDGELGLGRAVGPEWTESLAAFGASSSAGLQVEYNCEVSALVDASDSPDDDAEQWPLHVRLSNGAVHGVDFVVSATGVTPSTAWLPAELQRKPGDGGVIIDEQMQTSVPGVFAAGDVCCAKALEQASAHWFQMRLWTQARIMGTYAAQCMHNATAAEDDRLEAGLNFELFTHVTRFYGKKVILLGLYNGQRLDAEPSRDIVTYARSVEGPDSTFVRVLLLRGRMQGAVLIGDTDLEETFENLILAQLDLSSYGPSLLDPDAELDHIFD
jgi:NAD(P)H-nitrite reductase large subunit